MNKKALFDYLTEEDKELNELPDGAWAATMIDRVQGWLEGSGNKGDAHELWLEWVEKTSVPETKEKS